MDKFGAKAAVCMRWATFRSVGGGSLTNVKVEVGSWMHLQTMCLNTLDVNNVSWVEIGFEIS